MGGISTPQTHPNLAVQNADVSGMWPKQQTKLFVAAARQIQSFSEVFRKTLDAL